MAGVIQEYGKPEERMIKNYRRYVTGYPCIGQAVRAMVSEKVPTLVHCVNGKDRTGVLCAVLLTVAGIHHDDVVEDYLVTNAVNADLTEAEAERLGVGMTSFERGILMSFLEARPAYPEAFFDEVRVEFGTFDRYLKDGIGLSADQQADICELLG